ncbi:MAG: 3'-5' exonuclease, partial [Patescibacteria group bacterium]
MYGFRQADFRNILNFEKDYPEAKIIKLEENYRSVQNILDASQAIIEKNVFKTDKRLWTRRGRGDKLKIVEAFSEIDEANFVIQEIKDILAGEPSPAADLNDFVVLYRTNAQSRVFEEALMQEGWPYRLVGALKFYDRKEVKDILSYLRFIQNHNDLLSLKRIINVPGRGIGKTSQEKLTADFNRLILNPNPKIQAFATLIAELKNTAQDQKTSAFVKHLLAQINYKNYLLDFAANSPADYRSAEEAAESRWQNVLELVSVAAKFDNLPPPFGLTALLEDVALVSAADDVSHENGELNLMTLHSAKGLEFPVVFMVGAEEGLLPHSRSFYDTAQMEEERRLAYVGLTRAKERAYVCFTSQR